MQHAKEAHKAFAATVRRALGARSTPITNRGLILDLEDLNVKFKTTKLALTDKQRAILALLMWRSNEVLEKAQMHAFLIECGVDPFSPDGFTSSISELSAKLNRAGGMKWIYPVEDVGYIAIPSDVAIRIQPPREFTFDGFRLSLATRQVSIQPRGKNGVDTEVEVEVTYKEFELLVALCEADGHPVAKADLIAHIWRELGPPPENEQRALQTLVECVRQSLDDMRSPRRFVRTERGVGIALACGRPEPPNSGSQRLPSGRSDVGPVQPEDLIVVSSASTASPLGAILNGLAAQVVLVGLDTSNVKNTLARYDRLRVAHGERALERMLGRARREVRLAVLCGGVEDVAPISAIKRLDGAGKLAGNVRSLFVAQPADTDMVGAPVHPVSVSEWLSSPPHRSKPSDTPTQRGENWCRQVLTSAATLAAAYWSERCAVGRQAQPIVTADFALASLIEARAIEGLGAIDRNQARLMIVLGSTGSAGDSTRLERLRRSRDLSLISIPRNEKGEPDDSAEAVADYLARVELGLRRGLSVLASEPHLDPLVLDGLKQIAQRQAVGTMGLIVAERELSGERTPGFYALVDQLADGPFPDHVVLLS